MGRVLVTGMGIVSALGENISENYSSLHNGLTGIGKAKYFESFYSSILPFGEVKISNMQLEEQLQLEHTDYTRTCMLAVKACDEAIADSGLTANQLSSFETALISASTVGGMCLTDQLYQDANLKSGGSAYLNAYPCSAHTLKLISRYRIKG